MSPSPALSNDLERDVGLPVVGHVARIGGGESLAVLRALEHAGTDRLRVPAGAAADRLAEAGAAEPDWLEAVRRSTRPSVTRSRRCVPGPEPAAGPPRADRRYREHTAHDDTAVDDDERRRRRDMLRSWSAFAGARSGLGAGALAQTVAAVDASLEDDSTEPSNRG